MNPFSRRSLLAGAATLALSNAVFAQSETIKVGILHSLSGTMAISETTLKDAMLMLIDEQNKKGLSLLKRHVSSSQNIRWLQPLDVGLPSHVNQFCLSLKS
jgi:Periplasmic binding protein domain